MISRRLLSAALLSSALAATACSDTTAPEMAINPTAISRSGGGTTTSGASILPTTPPAPDVLLRESFGLAESQRPAGGKGTMKDVFAGTTLGGFWLEYPGTKNAQWLTPDVGQTWRFAGCSDNPLELPSPLQALYTGCVISDWFDPPTSYPTALMPIGVALPSAGYELSMEGWPAPIAGGYVAIGFTNSGALTSNLTTSGSLWLRVTDTTQYGGPLHYELRTGSLTSGQLIASGDGGWRGYNPMSIRYSPATGTVTLSFGGVVVGSYPVTIAPPKYLAFEGIGVLDDLVLRQ